MIPVTTKPAAARSVTWHPVDRIVLAYSLFMIGMIALIGRPVGEYVDELLFYLGTAGLTVLIVCFVNETTDRARAFVRILYPGMLVMFFYTMTGGQMFLLFDRFFDNQVVGWERALFGEEITLYIDQHLLNVPTTEVLSFCYFCYYLIFPGFLISAFIQRHDKIIREYLTATCLTFFVSYALFWLYPVEGPRWYLTGEYAHEVYGPLLRKLVVYVIDHAAVHGGAMPSSHTGVALVTLVFCFRYYRRAAWWLLPIVTGLALGTFWGRFHYFSDTVVGAAIGALAVWVVWRFVDPPNRRKASAGVSSLLRTQYVP
jgi:membrane-associated phospholipid phosphatase